MAGLLKSLVVRITLEEEMLGMSPDNPEIFSEFIAKNAPDAPSREEEMVALMNDVEPEEAEEILIEKGTTIFPKDEDGIPILWNYQCKGFCKDVCGMLRRAEGTLSSDLAAHKKVIDGLIFPKPRMIRLVLPEGGKIGYCQRPLRAQTAKGEITALVNSETVPEGTTLEVEIKYYELKGKAPKAMKKKGKDVKEENGEPAMSKSKMRETIIEWLDYGELRGLGQWRNSGKGVFSYEILEG